VGGVLKDWRNIHGIGEQLMASFKGAGSVALRNGRPRRPARKLSRQKRSGRLGRCWGGEAEGVQETAFSRLETPGLAPDTGEAILSAIDAQKPLSHSICQSSPANPSPAAEGV
jgi:hypothetical protein